MVRFHYLPRILGWLLLTLILISIYYESKNWLLWAIIGFQGILWPHLAYIIGLKSKHPKAAAYRCLFFEALLWGLWIVYLDFRLWPSTAFCIGAVINALTSGGLYLMLKCIIFMIVGLGLGVPVFGLEFIPESGLLTSFLSIFFVISYSIIVSLTSYANAKRLSDSKDQLKAANYELKQTRDELWGEMQLAKKIQTALLPKNPKIEGYEIAAFMQPAEAVGGDYYDIINLKNKDWIVIGDVSGHGVPAGLIMMMVQTAIHTVLEADTGLKPSILLSRINQVIFNNIRKLNEDKYMSITIFACLDDGNFYFSGLHQDIMIFRKQTQTVELIETEGIWIGITDKIEGMLKDHACRLDAGDTMLVYTDGIIEAWESGAARDKRDAKSEMFGKKRLRETLHRHGNDSSETIKQAVLEDLHDYVCDDDITMVIIKRNQ